jgi:GPH family glycoside/pentoside/hexuronide:cation symporter
MSSAQAEKKYLKWYNKLGYGSGDIAGNLIYGLITSFIMIYLTDTVGLSSGIVGTLIMVSKFFDGFTDIIFGNLMDRTHSKMGKARPWMLFSEIGCVVFLVLCFAVPMNWEKTAQYVFFFIVYTLLNAIFYTANNIAYAALTSLATRNNNERVQMGVIRFVFSISANVLLSYITVSLVKSFGGGALGWRNAAILYAGIALVFNTISVFSVKELPRENREGESLSGPKDEIGILQALKILITNKYFIIVLLTYIFFYLLSGFGGIAIFYMTYILGNPEQLGTFSLMGMVPMAIGLAATPFLVQKFGMYKTNLVGGIWSLAWRILFVVAGLMRNIPMMLVTVFLSGLGSAPIIGDINALIAATTDYTYKTKGVRVEGAMFSASSVGVKVGNGLGTALSGLLLDLSGYIPNAAQQPQAVLHMLDFMYLILPVIITVVLVLLQSRMTVEKANAEWDAAHPAREAN